MTDVRVIDQGTICLLVPESSKGKNWCDEFIPEVMVYGDGLAVEHRYAYDILEGMYEAGLNISGISSEPHYI